MKNLLRITGLAVVVTAATLPTAMGGLSSGTCHTSCFNLSTVTFTIVNWSATYEECCNGLVNPCPPGMLPASASFTPAGNFQTQRCPL
ncbi:MAG TPA: hypothetical protein VL025_18600 [Thermoanaerobaculia bacterium]|nr:hypothetical protein [Thermoanaerobaculia bacterium]